MNEPRWTDIKEDKEIGLEIYRQRQAQRRHNVEKAKPLNVQAKPKSIQEILFLMTQL